MKNCIFEVAASQNIRMINRKLLWLGFGDPSRDCKTFAFLIGKHLETTSVFPQFEYNMFNT